jgi:hypothetical protein
MTNFNEAYTHAQLLYDLELTPEDFEEIGLVAWNRIGNKQDVLYQMFVDIDCADKKVELPCNCDEIEAVTYCHEDWNYASNVSENGDYLSDFVEHYIESRKGYEDPLYQSGQYVKYRRVGNDLYFDKAYGPIIILYRGNIYDEEGLPYINEKEKDAIAAFCAYIMKFKEGMRTNNPNIIAFAQELKKEWLRLCDAARVTTYLNQNDANKILDAKTNWNRKVFNKSYKPVK